MMRMSGTDARDKLVSELRGLADFAAGVTVADLPAAYDSTREKIVEIDGLLFPMVWGKNHVEGDAWAGLERLAFDLLTEQTQLAASPEHINVRKAAESILRAGNYAATYLAKNGYEA